jgi:hypothetical protein
MFIPAHELMSFVPTDINEDDRLASTYSESHGLLRQKRQENTEASLGRESLNTSVARYGVVTPVIISENHERGVSIILNGHHRIAAAHDANPNMEVPVRNYE